MTLSIDLLLDKELAAVDAFLKLLQEEHEVLKRGPAERLHSIGEQKILLVDTLNALEVQRERLLDGVSGDTPGKRMEAWLAGKSAKSAHRSKWDKLLEQAREARRMHSINGELVNSLLRRTGDAIGILTQRQKEVSLYGSNGQATEVTGSRIVDSA
jgi:flagellar biosynthesis protein FlgN